MRYFHHFGLFCFMPAPNSRKLPQKRHTWAKFGNFCSFSGKIGSKINIS